MYEVMEEFRALTTHQPLEVLSLEMVVGMGAQLPIQAVIVMALVQVVVLVDTQVMAVALQT
tara:strand:+ start:149 stop:331 length:183 start_codon:yes stop_codon:yes gene_type:complete